MVTENSQKFGQFRSLSRRPIVKLISFLLSFLYDNIDKPFLYDNIDKPIIEELTLQRGCVQSEVKFD